MFSSNMERASTWQDPHQQQHHVPAQQTHHDHFLSPTRQSGWFQMQNNVGIQDQHHHHHYSTMRGGTGGGGGGGSGWLQEQEYLQDSRPRISTQHGGYPSVPRSSTHDVGEVAGLHHHTASYSWHDDHNRMTTSPLGIDHVGGVRMGAGTSQHSMADLEDRFLANRDHPHYHSDLSVMTSVPKSSIHGGVMHGTGMSPVMRKAKEVSIGRWNAEEHKWFLKGLEMFQGPAWGEIARLIGTRTSTQVRTHAQKFFTKLARLNQTLPYFEQQIMKERSRLIQQGAIAANSHSSVTPTATNATFNYALNSLSPRKSGDGSPRQTLKRFRDETITSDSSLSGQHPYTSNGYADQHEGIRTAVPYYPDHRSMDPTYIDKYEQNESTSPLLRKPRVFMDSGLHTSVISHQGSDQHQPHASYEVGYTGGPAAQSKSLLEQQQPRHYQSHGVDSHSTFRRDEMVYPIHTSAPMPSHTTHVHSGNKDWSEWSDNSSRYWTSTAGSSQATSVELDPSQPGYSSAVDADSLPSMNKLLYRGTTTA